MPFFDLGIRWVESSDFGPKSADLGHRILQSDFIPSDFAKSDLISRPIFFSDQKTKIRSSESDRMIEHWMGQIIYLRNEPNYYSCISKCDWKCPRSEDGHWDCWENDTHHTLTAINKTDKIILRCSIIWWPWELRPIRYKNIRNEARSAR